jgi:outer membrane protein assembly factor BamB
MIVLSVNSLFAFKNKNRMNSMQHMYIVALSLLISKTIMALDWNQWRGPARNGTIETSAPIIQSWSQKCPKKIWEATNIPGHANGGFSSISITNGKAYVFINWKKQEPIPTRKLTEGKLRNLGWFNEIDKIPPEIITKIEELRTSADREKLKGNELKTWVNNTISSLPLNEEQKKKFGNFLSSRLAAGKNALSLDTLNKLASIKDKEFPDQTFLNKWFDENNITDTERARIQKEIPVTREVANDVILCIDSSSGKILWKKEYPGVPTGYGSSSTPLIADSRVYVAGHNTVYCLESTTGDEIWKTSLSGKEVSSSPLIVKNVLVILGGILTGLDINDGKILWTQKAITGNNPSPVKWEKEDKTYIICNSNAGITCVDPQNGNIMWKVPGGGNGTVVIQDDIMVLLAERQETGLVAYKIRTEGAEKLWNVPYHDRGSTPVIYKNHVYGITGQGGKAYCVRLSDGKIMWEHSIGATEISSPILINDTIFVVLNGGKLQMFKASPEKYLDAGKITTGIIGCSTPSFSDGKLFCRTQNSIVCYDLTQLAE